MNEGWENLHWNENHPYAGRWIARIREQIISQGGSPQQALASAYTSRFKEIPIISYIPLQKLMTFSPVFFEIQTILNDNSGVYLVGGAVRDALTGRVSHDLDFVCKSNAKQIARKTAAALQADYFPLDLERGIYRVIHHLPENQAEIIDFSELRGPDLEQDLVLRDFSINAMSVDLQSPNQLIDPLGGAQALRDHLLTACSPNSFIQDPIRVLRGIRFAAEWNFRLEDHTRRWMKTAAPFLAETTIERRRDELMKILASGRPDTALRALDWLNALEYVLPGFQATRQEYGKEWWNNLLSQINSIKMLLAVLAVDHPHEQAGDWVSGLVAMKLGRFKTELSRHILDPIQPNYQRIAMIYLGMLCSGMAKENAANGFIDKLGVKLKFSRREIDYLSNFAICRQDCSDLAQNPRLPTPVDIYRYYLKRGSTGVDAVFGFLGEMHAKTRFAADQSIFTTAVDLGQALLDGWWNHQEWINPEAVIDGNDIIHALKISAGPEVGKWLDLIKEKQVAGKIHSRQQALDWVKSEFERS